MKGFIIWISLNVGLTLLNKYVYRRYEFDYPALLTAIQLGMSLVWSTLLLVAKREPLARRWREALSNWRLLGFSVLFWINIFLSNVALEYVTVSLLQVMRATIPAITLVLSWLLLGKRYSVSKVLAVICVCIGVCLATYGKLKGHVFGVVVGFASCLVSSGKSVVAAVLLKKKDDKDAPLLLLHQMSLFSTVQLLIVSSLSGEVSSLLQHAPWSGYLGNLLLLNGMTAFALNFTNFALTQRTSPLSVTIAGNFKNNLTIVIAALLFHTHFLPINIVGSVVAMISVFTYSLL